MRLEQLPIVLGVLVALIGLTIALDAWQAGGVAPLRERRRRTRAVPHKAGQTLVALGTLCMAAALIGRDTWRWGTISVIAGSVLLVIGAIMNRQYLKEVLLFRGAARRGEGEGEKNSRLNQTPPKSTRIR
jgi:xanthine/uracil permease